MVGGALEKLGEVLGESDGEVIQEKNVVTISDLPYNSSIFSWKFQAARPLVFSQRFTDDLLSGMNQVSFAHKTLS